MAGREAQGTVRPVAALAAIVLYCVACTPASAQQPATDAVIAHATVRDPNASFLDVPARRAELAGATDERVKAAIKALKPCPPTPYPEPQRGRIKVPPYYLSGVSGPTLPNYADHERPFSRLEDAVGMAATRYVATGDAAEARCLLGILLDWAEAGSLLDYDRRESSQAVYIVEWSAAAAGLSLSVVRAALERAEPEKLKRVTDWLVRVSRHQIDQALGGKPTDTSRRNNHAYWRGLQAAAVGVVAKDDTLFRHGLERFRDAIEELNAEGAWPLEMARRERALHYQNFALQPLVLLAELALRQGIDLYALSIGGRRLHDAVRFLLRAAADPAAIARYAPEEQYVRYVSPGSGDMAWAEFYLRRFPGEGAGLRSFLDRPLFNRRLAGGGTVYAAAAR